jgi:uracil DNA glycosylase
MKYSYHPLPASYLDVLSTNNFFKLVIIGKDPFPTAPTGIPFCKSSWIEHEQANNSGLYVLRSLWIDLNGAKHRYSVPAGLFYYLATQGIVFLNASYHFLNVKTIPQKDYQYIDMALNINEPIIRNAKDVLLCGQAKVIVDKIRALPDFVG